jgi:glyoxylase-like metal-dependent hydrolase (beta-lactamase superfamily II)
MTTPTTTSPATEARFEEVLPGLLASRPQELPFAPSLHIRAFLLRRPAGNVLVYSVDGLASSEEALAELGGVGRQYLNHAHEAMFASDRLTVPLHVHENDRESVAKGIDVAESFSGRHVLGRDFEAIPTPGHTPGATAYLWDSGEHRFLFTGDTIFLSKGEWVAAVLASSDRASYVESLRLVRELDFDVLVPWAATAGQPSFVRTDRADIERRLDAIIERVERGADR